MVNMPGRSIRDAFVKRIILIADRAQSRLPSNGYNGGNWGRYMNEELGGLIDRRSTP
jgi:hypothetical protein